MRIESFLLKVVVPMSMLIVVDDDGQSTSQLSLQNGAFGLSSGVSSGLIVGVSAVD